MKANLTTPLISLSIALLPLFFWGCSKDKGGGTDINIFTVQDDIALGQQLKQEIESKPQEYPLLDEIQYAEAYGHMYRMRDSILNTGELKYDETFEWEIGIIQNDSVLNAFCAPGGYIYFYTGIIKFLDNEAQCAGVLGHEMAHADLRHTTDQLTRAYGIQILLSIVLGNNPTKMAEIVAGLAAGVASLAFSRSAETEADEFGVKYLYKTEYDARGVAGFFEKLDGSPQPPVFLSTHPHPDDRYEHIQEVWQSLGGEEGELFEDRYQNFISILP